MLLVVKKRSLFYMLTGFLLVTISLGTYRIALHPNMQEWVQNKTVITRVNTVQKAVAITFDDGPDPDNTPLILNSLKKHNAKGTFFLVGRLIEKQAPLVRQIASQGHEIGNHSYSHADFNHKDRESIVGEIRSTNDLIYKLTGQKPVLFRPPGGYLSYLLVDITRAEKVTIAYWTYQQDSKDWKGARAEKIAGHVVDHIAPGQIIILHDGGKNGGETARAVEMILTRLGQEGYRFVTMSELIKLDQK